MMMIIASIIPTRATVKLGEPDLILLLSFNLDAMKNSNLILGDAKSKSEIICKNTYFFLIYSIFSFILFSNLLILHPDS